jgi:hypothetical protein
VSRAKYELGFYIPEDGNLHSQRRGNLKSYLSWFPFNGCHYRVSVEDRETFQSIYRFAYTYLKVSVQIHTLNDSVHSVTGNKAVRQSW